ncbi:MAG: WGR domain-containing protein [Pseudomonadota bacterium]
MIECAILLEARNPAKNIFRSYFITARYDLFKRLSVEVTHGRIGARGKRSTFHPSNEQEAFEYIAALLQRRASAFQRLGTSYTLKYYSGKWNMDEALFPFRQTLLFEDTSSTSEKKTSIKEIIKDGEGLFG